MNPAEKHLAIRTEDHPLEYADFEGVIPDGQYGAGTVMVWDTGTYDPRNGIPPDTQLARGKIDVVLHGTKLRGGFTLVRTGKGFVVVGDRRQPLTEIELELKAGEETALYDLAVRLADVLPLRLEIMSKAERGFMLAANERPLPVRAAALQFPADATLDDAVEVVISSALCQFVANWPAMTETLLFWRAEPGGTLCPGLNYCG